MSITKTPQIRYKELTPIPKREYVGYRDNTSQQSVYLERPTAEVITHDAYDMYIDEDLTGMGDSSPNRKRLTYSCIDKSSCVSSDLSPIDQFLPMSQTKITRSSHKKLLLINPKIDSIF